MSFTELCITIGISIPIGCGCMFCCVSSIVFSHTLEPCISKCCPTPHHSEVHHIDSTEVVTEPIGQTVPAVVIADDKDISCIELLSGQYTITNVSTMTNVVMPMAVPVS